jgi:hypothetical protein
MDEYVIGNVVTVQTSFRDVNSILTDPLLVYLIVNKAGETTVQYEYGVGSQITKTATGVYSTNLILNIVGGWNYYWFCSGTLAADDGQFIVTPSRV